VETDLDQKKPLNNRHINIEHKNWSVKI